MTGLAMLLVMDGQHEAAALIDLVTSHAGQFFPRAVGLEHASFGEVGRMVEAELAGIFTGRQQWIEPFPSGIPDGRQGNLSRPGSGIVHRWHGWP